MLYLCLSPSDMGKNLHTLVVNVPMSSNYVKTLPTYVLIVPISHRYGGNSTHPRYNCAYLTQIWEYIHPTHVVIVSISSKYGKTLLTHIVVPISLGYGKTAPNLVLIVPISPKY